MMNSKPKDRIKLPLIKKHSFFSKWNVSFVDVEQRTSSMSHSGLLTDSMMLDGDDPFDDFMNKKLIGSGMNSARQSEGSTDPFNRSSGEFEEKQRSEASLLNPIPQGNSCFKKVGNRDCQTSAGGSLLETIPEERAVN